MPSIISINIDARKEKLIKVAKFIELKQPDVVAIQDLPSMKTDNELKRFFQQTTPSFQSITSQPTLDSLFISKQTGQLSKPDAKLCRATRRAKSYNVILRNKQTVNLNMIIEQKDDESDETENEKEEENLDVLTRSNMSIEKILYCGERAYATTISIALQMEAKQQLFYLTSIYIRPTAQYDEVGKLFYKHLNMIIKHFKKSRQVIMGDMNTQTIFWTPMQKLDRQLCLTKVKNWNYNFKQINDHYERAKKRARILTHFMQQNKLIAMNDVNAGPTYINIYQNHHSYIDCILMGNKAFRFFTNFTIIDLDDESMRHKLICLDAKFKVQQQQQLFKIVKTFNWHRIDNSRLIDLKQEIEQIILPTNNNNKNNWKEFQRQELVEKLDYIVLKLQKCLIDIQENICTERRLIKPISTSNPSIEEEIQLKKKVKSSTWLPKFKSIINSVKRNEIDQKYLDSIWKQVRNVKQHIEDAAAATSLSSSNNNNQFKLDEILQSQFPESKRDKAFELHKQMLTSSQSLYSTQIEDSEIEVVLNELINKKTYVGPDGIHFKTLSHTIQHVKSILFIIVNHLFIQRIVHNQL